MDFDWDLSDKTDTETQTRHGESEERTGPADAIVQVESLVAALRDTWTDDKDTT